MKYLTGYLLSLFFSSTLFASNLCDSFCDLSITFPDGGSIEAVEMLTVTFGDGAFVNNGTVITGYSAGDVLSLSAGESIDFQGNGSFELGSGGNIDYSDILIISNGVMDLAAVEGNKKVSIYDMTLLGSAALNISSSVDVAENGSFHIFSGPVTTSTELAFTSYGSVSGLFDFEQATLTLDKETYDITGSVLIEVDGQLTMTSKEVVINTASPVTTGTPGEESITDGSELASASGGAGLINLLSLSVMFVLMVSLRLQSVSSKKIREHLNG
jgi:hypothetical protein